MRAALISPSPDQRPGLGRVGGSFRRSISVEPSCGQRAGRGTCRSEGLIAGEHVPDRLAELAGDLDARDLLAALAAQALGGALVVVAIGGMAGGVGGALDQRPAQELRAVLGQA